VEAVRGGRYHTLIGEMEIRIEKNLIRVGDKDEGKNGERKEKKKGKEGEEVGIVRCKSC